MSLSKAGSASAFVFANSATGILVVKAVCSNPYPDQSNNYELIFILLEW
jgi:hypothetical protein